MQRVITAYVYIYFEQLSSMVKWDSHQKLTISPSQIGAYFDSEYRDQNIFCCVFLLQWLTLV